MQYFNPMYGLLTRKLRKALIDIHNQVAVQPKDYDDAMVTIECIRDILKEVEEQYLPEKNKEKEEDEPS